MADALDYSRIRSVEVFPAEVSGQKVICLRDPLNLSGKILFFPYPTFFIISLFDGAHSLVDIQAEFMRRFGELLYREKIRELVIQLDEHFLLDNERFRGAEQKIIEDFKRSPLRPLTLTDDSYGGPPSRSTGRERSSTARSPGSRKKWRTPATSGNSAAFRRS